MVNLLKRSVTEAVGTAILVFFGPGAVAITLMLAEGTSVTSDFNIGIGALGGLGTWFAIGMAFALPIAAIIYATGRVSGAHINPAVTIALWATKRFPSRDAAAYIIAQMVGAAFGSVLFFGCVGMEAVTVGALGAPTPFPGITYGQAILAEAVGTFMLMLAIMGTAVDRRAPSGFAGLVIGLTVAGSVTVIGNVSGSAINTARAFGPILFDWLLGGPNLWYFFPIYIIGPIVGAVAAAFFYDYINKEDESG